jgi:hypothetical protein
MWLFLVALAALGIAIGVAMRFVREEDRNGRILAVVVVFIVLNLAGRSVVKPYAEEQKRMENPLYRAVKAHEPEIYAEFKNIEGDNHLQMLMKMQAHAATLLTKYAPRASDESLRRFVQLSVEQLEIIASATKDGGHSALFPQAGNLNVGELSKLMTEERVQAQIGAFAAIVESGAQSQPKPMDPQRASYLMAKVSDRVMQQYGSTRISALGLPEQMSEASRPNAAQMVLSTYKEVLKLPPDESALVIRNMLSRADRGMSAAF